MVALLRPSSLLHEHSPCTLALLHRRRDANCCVPIRLDSPDECGRLCDTFYAKGPDELRRGGRVQLAQLKAECTMWTLSDRACVGHTDYGLVGPQDVSRTDRGISTCAPDAAVEAARQRVEEQSQRPAIFAMVRIAASIGPSCFSIASSHVDL